MSLSLNHPEKRVARPTYSKSQLLLLANFIKKQKRENLLMWRRKALVSLWVCWSHPLTWNKELLSGYFGYCPSLRPSRTTSQREKKALKDMICNWEESSAVFFTTFLMLPYFLLANISPLSFLASEEVHNKLKFSFGLLCLCRRVSFRARRTAAEWFEASWLSPTSRL